jgi:hypothetical protein
MSTATTRTSTRRATVQPQCITLPCDPVAVCVPGDEPPTSPCDAVRCAEGTHCEEVEVQCFTTPCNPVAECVPDDDDEVPCAVALCPEGTYCDDFDGSAECIPLPSCEAVCCAEGYTCELVEVQCIRAPCPPQPECVPVVDDPTSCAATLCMEGTYCDDISGHAECIPLPSCDAVRCEDGTHCELVEVQCIRAPCPPQPSCVAN